MEERPQDGLGRLHRLPSFIFFQPWPPRELPFWVRRSRKPSSPMKKDALGTLPTIVDLSHHQDNVQFGLLKDWGVEAVILKATEGTKHVDNRFAEYVERARSKGLLIGAYHFLDGSDPDKQWQHFRDVTASYSPLLLCLDYERNTTPGGTQATPETLAGMVHASLRELGRHPVVYGSEGDRLGPLLRSTKCDREVKACPRWIAKYGKVRPKTLCSLWQFTSTARIGNQGPYDGSILTSPDYSTVAAFWKRWAV